MLAAKKAVCPAVFLVFAKPLVEAIHPMIHKRLLAFLVNFSALGALLTSTPSAWAAPKYKILHAFGNGQDGAGAYGSLLLDKKGNLYGTTSGGGLYSYGTVFELTPGSGGQWDESILYNFENNGSDGCTSVSGLAFDTNGDLYGASERCGEFGYGAVFELTPGSGSWSESVLFSFNLHDGCCPQGGAVVVNGGNVYGAGGVAFELSRGSSGWTETILHDFNRDRRDGYLPLGGVIRDASGNLYGTTEVGGNRCGSSSCGTVFELSPLAGGDWKETVLFRFNSHDGAWPSDALFMDGSGALYGTTINGGCCGGVVFKLAPRSDGHWKESTVYEFKGGASGFLPGPGVVMDNAGNLYGATDGGGSPQCSCGVVYKLSPKKNGKWKYTVLHTFLGSDGAQPAANLTLDDKGNLYGTTSTGGPYFDGVAFELTP